MPKVTEAGDKRRNNVTVRLPKGVETRTLTYSAFSDKYYDTKSERARDPISGRCITKPKGPQGNKPQGVIGAVVDWDMGRISPKVFDNVASEVQNLRRSIKSSTMAVFVSDLRRALWPWMFIVILHRSLAFRMQIVIRNIDEYPYNRHYLECRFAEDGGQEHRMTFRSLCLSTFTTYFIQQYEGLKNANHAELIQEERADTALHVLQSEHVSSQSRDTLDLTAAAFKTCSCEAAGGRFSRLSSRFNEVVLEVAKELIRSPSSFASGHLTTELAIHSQHVGTTAGATKEHPMEVPDDGSDEDFRSTDKTSPEFFETPLTSLQVTPEVRELSDSELTDADAEGEPDSDQELEDNSDAFKETNSGDNDEVQSDNICTENEEALMRQEMADAWTNEESDEENASIIQSCNSGGVPMRRRVMVLDSTGDMAAWSP